MGSFVDEIGKVAGAIPNAIIGDKAAVTAGEQQQSAIQNAENTVQNTYNANSPNYQPFIQNGITANNKATQMATNGFGLSNFQQDPGYAFNMQQGLNAINNSQSVRGGALSGGAQKALSGYAQQNASNEYQNAYNRFASQQGQLSSLGNQGLSATSGLAQLGSNYSAQMANLQAGMGNSQASETLAKAGAFTSAFGPYGQTAQANQGTSMSGILQGLSSMFGSGASSSGTAQTANCADNTMALGESSGGASAFGDDAAASGSTLSDAAFSDAAAIV